MSNIFKQKRLETKHAHKMLEKSSQLRSSQFSIYGSVSILRSNMVQYLSFGQIWFGIWASRSVRYLHFGYLWIGHLFFGHHWFGRLRLNHLLFDHPSFRYVLIHKSTAYKMHMNSFLNSYSPSIVEADTLGQMILNFAYFRRSLFNNSTLMG